MISDGVVLYLVWLCASLLLYNSGKLLRRIIISGVDW